MGRSQASLKASGLRYCTNKNEMTHQNRTCYLKDNYNFTFHLLWILAVH
jgi:hypothetical protein